MGFPVTLKDANGIPISSVYIPGVGWAALQGSTNSNTDGSSNVSSAAMLEISRMNGIAPLLDAAGQMTIEQFIQYQIMQGHGFQTTTGFLSTGAANAFICVQLAVNAISKNVLIYSISVYNSNNANDIRINTSTVSTADANLTALTAYNMQPDSATVTALTTLAGSPAATTQTTGLVGTQSAGFGCAGSTLVQLLTNNAIYFLKAGDTSGIEVVNKVPTSGNSATITVQWIEW